MNDNELRGAVREKYGRIAEATPSGSGCCGSSCGCGSGSGNGLDQLGYTAEQRAAVPDGADLGLGCGNPLAGAGVVPGETILDLGSGAGIDCFLAARETGPSGRVIGVDMTPAMREAAAAAARRAGFGGIVEIREGFFERLPVADESVDLVLSNGVVNLSPDKEQVFREMHRVLKPGGRLYLADVVVQRELKDDVRNNPDLWAACIAGALPEPELATLALATGFDEARIVERFDCFRGTTAEVKVSGDLRVQAVNFHARKGSAAARR